MKASSLFLRIVGGGLGNEGSAQFLRSGCVWVLLLFTPILLSLHEYLETSFIHVLRRCYHLDTRLGFFLSR